MAKATATNTVSVTLKLNDAEVRALMVLTLNSSGSDIVDGIYGSLEEASPYIVCDKDDVQLRTSSYPQFLPTADAVFNAARVND